MRDAYGRNPFGQGCLLARRLVERGVPFVEVTLSSVNGQNGGLGWDTHAQNFDAVKGLSTVLDAGWATLMHDLRTRGLLDSTLIVWMGEFGRTPKINEQAGRDHFPNAWSTVLAGGWSQGGPGDRRYRSGWHGGPRPPGVGARPARDGRAGARPRPDDPEHCRERASDPPCRSQGQADCGSLCMIPSVLLAALTLGLGDAPAPPLPPAATFTAAGEAATQDLIILGEKPASLAPGPGSDR